MYQLICKDLVCEVWRCDLDQKIPADEYNILSLEEKTRAGQFFQNLHRQRYLAAHVGLRRLISYKTGTLPSDLCFIKGHMGKPRLVNPSPWAFNMSHSGGVALVALSSRFQVGVDIEVPVDSDNLEEMAEAHFSQRELLAWVGLPRSKQNKMFFRLWTRKEACVKATGWGLHLPLSEVEVGMETSRRMVALSLPDGTSVDVTVESLKLESGSVGSFAWLKA